MRKVPKSIACRQSDSSRLNLTLNLIIETIYISYLILTKTCQKQGKKGKEKKDPDYILTMKEGYVTRIHFQIIIIYKFITTYQDFYPKKEIEKTQLD